MPNSSANRRQPDGAKSRQRSRIANGSVIVSADHLADLPDASVSEHSIVRRASVLEVELERMETKFALAGEASVDDLVLYQRTAGNLRRLLESVGLQRRSKDVTTLTIGDLLQQDRKHKQDGSHVVD